MGSNTSISGSYVISAICVCIEYLLLGLVHRRHDHELGLPMHAQHRMLLASFFVKLFFIVVELGLAIAFGVTEYTGRYNISAIFEWVVALTYIFCKLSPSRIEGSFSHNLEHKTDRDSAQMFGPTLWTSCRSTTRCGLGASRSCQKLAKAATKWS